MTFDAGGSQRQACTLFGRSQHPHPQCGGQESFWVEDLTEQEAQQLLELQGHGQDWEQFVAACSPAAASACLEGVLCSLS